MTVAVPMLVILVMLAFNALYVGAEFATVGARRSRVQEQADGGSRGAAGLLAILQDPVRVDGYVATCQVGITVSSLAAGAYGQAQLTPLLAPVFGAGGQAVAIAIVLVAITSLQVVLGELLPKTAALRYPERMAIATLPPMKLSLWLFRPLVTLFNGSALRLMQSMNLDVDHSHAHVHSPEELEGLYRASAAGGLIDANERDMVAGVLNVEHRRVVEIMTPRRRLVTARAEETVSAALARVVASPHTRFPVVDDTDDVVGLVSLRELYLHAQDNPDEAVAQVAGPILEFAEFLTVPELWQRLRDATAHCATVVNEFGSVVGMVTLEDALEEIFGELRDEFDQETDPITLAGGRMAVRGDVPVETLFTRLERHAPDVDVDLVGGLVWHLLGRRPEVGDELDVGDDDAPLRLRVDEVDGTSVVWVSLPAPEASS